MKLIFPTILLILSALFFGCETKVTNPINCVVTYKELSCRAQPESSFEFAVFNASTLIGLLRDPACAGLRFYNVMETKGDVRGTVAVAGYDASECDMPDDYFRSDGLAESAAVEYKYPSRREVVVASSYVRDVYYRNFSTKFSKTELEILFRRAPKCDGLVVTPEFYGGRESMRIEMVTFGLFRYTPSSYYLICTEPCPTACPSQAATVANPPCPLVTGDW